MRILDRYLLRKFLHAYLICFFSLIGLYVVIDAFNNLDEFGERSANAAETVLHMGSYYGYRMSLFFDQLSGAITMLAAMFALTWMRRNGEVTPLLAAGVSVWRVIAPILGAAVAVGAVAVVNQELIIPRIRVELLRDADDPEGEKSQPAGGAYDFQTNIFIEAKRAYVREQRLVRVNVMLPPELAGSLMVVSAQEARYRRGDVREPAGWELLDTEPAELPPLPPTAAEVLRQTRPGRILLVSNVTMDRMLPETSALQYASTAELVRRLRDPSLGYGVEQAVYVHQRLLRPLGNIVLLLMGLPFVLGRESRNLFINMGVCLVISGVFFAATYGCQYLGNLEYISPSLAAWLPVIVFGTALAVLLDMVQT